MSERSTLSNSVHQVPHTAKATRRTNGRAWLEVTIGVRRKKDLPDLSSVDAVPPGKRRYMTHDELSAGYGSAPDAVDTIRKFAGAHNLEIIREDPVSARMTLGGTVSDLSAAFGVTLFDYQDPVLGAFHARTGPVSVPTELKNDITGVFGFSNQRHLRRKHKPKLVEAAATMAKRAWFVPTELADIYNFPANDAAGQCVALLEFGGGVDDSDVTAYFSHIKVPKPNVTIVGGGAVDPSSDPESTGEVMLDIDVAGALAPGATIAVYFSTFDEKGLIDAISAVISDTQNKPSVVSISWGWDENQPFQRDITWSPAAIDHVNHSLLAAAHLGITVCVSTGDDGSEAQIQDGRAHVNYPASSPYVLAVGGTSLTVRQTSAGSSAIRETVWNDGPGSGTGGGISDYTARPDWQNGIVDPSINPGGFVGRGIPDVAANADPATGYLTQSGGKLGVVGGTSAAAPLWASLIARVNKAMGARAGNFNALLYKNWGPAGVLRDITLGNNDTDGLLGGQFAAKAGWDACTGWGAPDGKKLLAAMTGQPNPVG
jgi:kumamolisin